MNQWQCEEQKAQDDAIAFPVHIAKIQLYIECEMDIYFKKRSFPFYYGVVCRASSLSLLIRWLCLCWFGWNCGVVGFVDFPKVGGGF